MKLILTAIAALLYCASGAQLDAAGAARIKDIARVQGVRSNQLLGYGLVIGLNGTGDSKAAPFMPAAVSNMLERFQMSVPARDIKVKNIAAVMVTAELPPFAKPGSRIDVTVSAIGDARSLQGGMLLMSELQAADGQVYAVAQGAVSIGGFSVSSGGASAAKNHPTVGRVPGGASVEREAPMTFVRPNNQIDIELLQPDFTTAIRIATAIQKQFPKLEVTAPSPGSVRIQLPEDERQDPVMLVASLEALRVEPDVSAKVVVNERTGTVVINGNARIAPVAIAHGGIQVKISVTPLVSQPNPLGEGQTTIVNKTNVKVEEKTAQVALLNEGASVESLVKALNALGVTPTDLIAILQSLKAAGALHGEIEIQ